MVLEHGFQMSLMRVKGMKISEAQFEQTFVSLNQGQYNCTESLPVPRTDCNTEVGLSAILLRRRLTGDFKVARLPRGLCCVLFKPPPGCISDLFWEACSNRYFPIRFRKSPGNEYFLRQTSVNKKYQLKSLNIHKQKMSIHY